MCKKCHLILIRHGETDGNAFMYRSKFLGDNSGFSEEFRKSDSFGWKLTDEGRVQAQLVGEWLKKQIKLSDFQLFHSAHLRTEETAKLIFPDELWKIEPLVVGRVWGGIECVPFSEHGDYCFSRGYKKLPNGFFEKYPNGESMETVWLRVKLFLEKLEKSAVVVTHGEVIQMFRVIIENISPTSYLRLETNSNHIRNGQVVWYSSQDPVLKHCLGSFSFKRLFFSKIETDWTNLPAKSF